MEEKELIEKVLNQEEIAHEVIPDEQQSPLIQKVAEKALVMEEPKEEKAKPAEESIEEQHKKFRDSSLEQLKKEAEEEKKNEREKEKESPSAEGEEEKEKTSFEEKPIEQPLDAPEQEINEQPKSSDPAEASDSMENFEVPIGHAKLMADTFLGVANNIIEVGGGIFVKIKKHKEFYDFEEVIQIIDEQNTRNIQRLKLDEEDKALLRPLLIAVLRKRAKQMSPESLLLGAALSILIKKYKIAMECRAENALLEERLVAVIKANRIIETKPSPENNPDDNIKEAA